ncbi:tetratricopeptide repeat protein [Okeania sp. SIO1F9]|nr:tetratricopeptide repeat protein [Okeania sp. SIO1F9]NET78594.1 tetratricopeptide repeat protein [Okeania sp. SIO1F9]
MHSQLNLETKVVENLQQAETYLAKGKLDKAQVACQQVLAALPDFAPGYKIQGNISLAMGQVEEAMGWYKKALTAQPNWAEVHANMGSLYAMQKKWQLAIASYQKAISLQPNIAGFYRNLAKIWQFVGKSELAAECSYQVLTLEPESATASEFLSLGKTLFEQKKLGEAIACYSGAIKLNPNLFKAYHLLGDALIIQGNLDEAISYYQKAIKLQPNKWRAYQKLGKALLEKGEFAEAVVSFQKAIEINPNSIWSYPKLGLSLMKLKNWDAAINAYRKAMELNPNHPNNYYVLGKILEDKNQQDEAIAIYQQGLEKLPKETKLARKIEWLLRDKKPRLVKHYRSYGNIQKQIGNLEEAITAYREIIKIKSQNSDYYELGILLVKQENWEQALLCYKELLKVQPWLNKEVKKYLELGIALVRAGKLGEVVDLYHKVFQKNIHNLEFYYQFSINLSEVGLISEAVNFFKKLPKPQLPKQPQPLQNKNSNSIYDFIWDSLNQTNSQDVDLHIELETIELESEKIQNHFYQKHLKTFAIDKLQPEEVDFLEKCGIYLEYVKLTRIENSDLENIYINCFEDGNVVVKTRTNNIKKKYIKRNIGGYKYPPVEFTQNLVEFGYMYAVCPLSGQVVRSNTSFYLPRLNIIYRFEGEEVFYIIVNDFIGLKAGLYIPKLNIYIAFGKTTNNIIYKFQTYVVNNWQDVRDYLGNVNRSLVEIYGAMRNLGHFFWQDITGIYYLYEQNLLEKIDYFCGGDNQHLNLLSIFPEIPENKILNMSEMSWEERFRLMLKNNFFCLRITDAFIKKSIGNRIYQAAYNLCSPGFIEEVKKAKENNNLLLWINIRTHNKIWMDQDKNYAKIITQLSNDFSHLNMGIVFDGTPDASDCVKSIIEQTKSQVNFYNTTLKIKLHESIVFAHYIDAYIAVVGSGLVITSWLSDKPGVAHGDLAHLGQKCFWSQVKESGIEPIFLNRQDIKQSQKGAYKNYQIDWQIIYEKISQILKKIEQQKQMTEN